MERREVERRMDWKTLLAYITGTVDQELLLRNEYLITENRILRNQLNDAGSGKRDYSRPLPSEPDVKVSLHPAQASQRPCEGPVSSTTTCWLHDNTRWSISLSSTGSPWTAYAFAGP